MVEVPIVEPEVGWVVVVSRAGVVDVADAPARREGFSMSVATLEGPPT